MITQQQQSGMDLAEKHFAGILKAISLLLDVDLAVLLLGVADENQDQGLTEILPLVIRVTHCIFRKDEELVDIFLQLLGQWLVRRVDKVRAVREQLRRTQGAT